MRAAPLISAAQCCAVRAAPTVITPRHPQRAPHPMVTIHGLMLASGAVMRPNASHVEQFFASQPDAYEMSPLMTTESTWWGEWGARQRQC